MPAFYFPICALLVQIVLNVVFFYKTKAIRQNNLFFPQMLVLGLIDALIISAVMLLSYVDFDNYVFINKIANKIDFFLYTMWAAYFLLYIYTIPNTKNAWFIKNKSKLLHVLVIINVIAWLFVWILPIEVHNFKNVTFYASGLSTEIPLYLCAVYLLLVFLRTITLRKHLTRKYVSVPVVLGLLLLTVFIRAYYPGIAVIPFVVAISNLVILLTFENPEAKLLSIEEHNRKVLKKVDSAKDDFISMASHQLRTPLTSIKGYVSMLLSGDFGHLSTEQKKVLSEAYTNSERMAFLIDDFLDVSRLQLGKLELQKMPTRLSQILETEITQLKAAADMRNITIKYNTPESLPILDIDANKLRQVMMNMIDNAIFYSHPRGEIVIELYQQRGQVVFMVKDQGIGVPRGEQHKLFTKFYRASNARKARPDGSGVGLYVARKIIVAHGGSLIFESTENVGSTFGFRLPIKSAKA